jgi:hypothetical protein
MRPELQAIADRQGGIVLRQQALAADYDAAELRALLRPGGELVAVRRGAYAERHVIEAASATDRLIAKDWAAHLVTRVPHVMSHDSAARMHRLPLIDSDSAESHITRSRLSGARNEHGIRHHLARRPVSVEDVGGLIATGMARTVIDLGRWHGYAQGVVAADSALRAGVPRADLIAELGRESTWPDTAAVRPAVAFADAGAENIAESLSRILVSELGLGTVHTQFAVMIRDGSIVWCDIRVGCHVFEFDGKIKYTPVDQGGVATKPIEQVLWEERKRQQQICAVGLGMSRLTWSDLHGPARERAKARLREEYTVTRARFGGVLPAHLAEFAAAHPRAGGGGGSLLPPAHATA